MPDVRQEWNNDLGDAREAVCEMQLSCRLSMNDASEDAGF